jgi:hypothetical protein
MKETSISSAGVVDDLSSLVGGVANQSGAAHVCQI